jgi:hypothetical protein
MEFHHPYFIKGKEQFLEYIKRKVLFFINFFFFFAFDHKKRSYFQ